MRGPPWQVRAQKAERVGELSLALEEKVREVALAEGRLAEEARRYGAAREADGRELVRAATAAGAGALAEESLTSCRRQLVAARRAESEAREEAEGRAREVSERREMGAVGRALQSTSSCFGAEPAQLLRPAIDICGGLVNRLAGSRWDRTVG
eukprot:COSAG01_NODE_3685_length_5797_cov_4.035802_2_plen_153_part_00